MGQNCNLTKWANTLIILSTHITKVTWAKQYKKNDTNKIGSDGTSDDFGPFWKPKHHI